MTAYNFKKEFAPLVEQGIKKQTIRKKRKYPTRKGDTLYLYTGMMHTNCRRLLPPTPCTDVRAIRITDLRVELDGIPIHHERVNEIAKADGFDNVVAFKDFFKTTYGLPFSGELVMWD